MPGFMTEFGAVRGNKNEVKHISSNLAWNSVFVPVKTGRHVNQYDPDPTDAPQMPHRSIATCRSAACRRQAHAELDLLAAQEIPQLHYRVLLQW